MSDLIGTLGRMLRHGAASERRPERGADRELPKLLDNTYESLLAFHSESFERTLDALLEALAGAREAIGLEAWHERIALIRRHPLFSLVLHDPVTYRAYHKPRGHAADAVMLDLVYQDDSPPPGVSDLGGRLWTYVAGTPLAQAMRNRRDWIAEQIDATAERAAGAEVLAIEAGHLREAHRSQAVKRGALRRFVALDHDTEALRCVEREFGRSQVSPIHTPTYAVLSGGHSALGYFDFVYSAGLFDRLDDERAARAVGSIFGMLKPGGKMWIANICPSVREAAYLEVFMNWWPVYRGLDRLEALMTGISRAELRSHRSFLEPTDNIAFLELVRA